MINYADNVLNLSKTLLCVFGRIFLNLAGNVLKTGLKKRKREREKVSCFS